MRNFISVNILEKSYPTLLKIIEEPTNNELTLYISRNDARNDNQKGATIKATIINQNLVFENGLAAFSFRFIREENFNGDEPFLIIEEGVLSNSYKRKNMDQAIFYQQKIYQSLENVYQAMKFLTYPCKNNVIFSEIIRKTRDRKKIFELGHLHYENNEFYKAKVFELWDSIKITKMHEALKLKFSIDYFRLCLCATGDRYIYYQGDQYEKLSDFWTIGVNGTGRNMIGELLMELRAELRG